MTMVQIPRQTDAITTADLGRGYRVGRAELPGPPAIRNQIRSIPIQLDSLPEGLRVSTPLARGWAAVARTPHQLAQAIAQAFTEAQVASYARWHGVAYDQDELTDVVSGDSLAAATRTQDFRRRERSDQHDPGDWTPLSDGFWRSPGGRRYRPDAAIVQRVRRRRRELGLDSL